MNIPFFIGLLGSLVLVTGAAWPESKDIHHPMKSIKNWLFSVGSALMFIYALLGYLGDGPIFFVILQIFILVAVILMMVDTKEKMDFWILTITGGGMILWSLYLFEGYNTIFFVIGLIGIGLGYVFNAITVRRELALTFGSALIAIFSYLSGDWIFFWLNVFFALFSGYYLIKILQKKH